MQEFPNHIIKTAEKLVAHCQAGTEKQGLDEYYHPDCVSVEALDMPDKDRETKGLDGIRGKHEWWESNFEVHSASTDGPYVHSDNKFSVIFEMDSTHKETDQRAQMKEIGLYTVNDNGQIIREEFFYAAE